MNKSFMNAISKIALISGALFAAPVLAYEASIMVIGDSISAGYQQPSYRMHLYQTLQAEQCEVDMVGDQTVTSFKYSDPAGSPGYNFPSFDPSTHPGYASGAHWDPAQGDDVDHQAFPSITTDRVANGTRSAFYQVYPIASYVSQFQPDYALIHLGTNDLNDEIEAGMDTDAEIESWANTTITEIMLVINRTKQAHNNPSSLKILLANMIPYQKEYTDPVKALTAMEASSVFTSKLETLVSEQADPLLMIVDVATGFDNDTMTFDGVHPNAVGERHIADKFLTVLKGSGLCAGNEPALVSPSSGSSITGSTTTIQWADNGQSVDEWRVYVGNSQSGTSSTYFDSGNLTANIRSIDVTGLPADGSNVFISLRYRVGTEWQTTLTNVFSQADTTGGTTTPELTSPVVGSVLSGSTQGITWTRNSTSVTQWFVRAGTASDIDAYFSSGRITDASTRSLTLTGLPTDGSTVQIGLFWKLPSGAWGSDTFSYTAAGGTTTGGTSGGSTSGETDGGSTTSGETTGGTTGGTTTTPELTSPVVGSVLAGSTQDITWTNNSTSVIQWFVEAGTTSVVDAYFSSGRITDGTLRSLTLTGLPTDGSEVVIRLQWKLPSGPWENETFSYTAANGTTTGSTTGTDGSDTGSTTSGTTTGTDGTETGSTTTGSTTGSDTGSTTSGSTTGTDGGDTGSTTSGETTGGTTGGTVTTPELTSPVAGSVLSGSTQDITWTNNSTSVIQWFVRAGTASDIDAYFSSGRITDVSTSNLTLTGLPTDGSTVLVRLLWKLSSGSWNSETYSYTAAGGATTGSTSGGGTTGGSTSGGETDGGSTGGDTVTPEITSPSVGSTLSGSIETFQWTNNSTSATQWLLEAGTASNNKAYYSSGRITDATTRSINVTGLPTDGSNVVVRLSWKMPSGEWARETFDFTAASE